MSYVQCPYCKVENEINHDDGFGYEEDVEHELQCDSCNKSFIFLTSITYNFDSYCGNYDDHELYAPFDNNSDFKMCKNCEFSIMDRSKKKGVIYVASKINSKG